MIGIEPMTSPFVYTSTSQKAYKRTRLYLTHIFRLSVPCQSFGRECRHGLTQYFRALTVIRDSLSRFQNSGQCDYHGGALPTELHWLTSYILLDFKDFCKNKIKANALILLLRGIWSPVLNSDFALRDSSSLRTRDLVRSYFFTLRYKKYIRSFQIPSIAAK